METLTQKFLGKVGLKSKPQNLVWLRYNSLILSLLQQCGSILKDPTICPAHKILNNGDILS